MWLQVHKSWESLILGSVETGIGLQRQVPPSCFEDAVSKRLGFWGAGLVALMAAKAFGADSVAITDIKNDKCVPSIQVPTVVPNPI